MALSAMQGVVGPALPQVFVDQDVHICTKQGPLWPLEPVCFRKVQYRHEML